jgi:putative acetyltransferase
MRLAMTSTVRVRPEEPPDAPAIHAVHAAAFGQEPEAQFVDELRARGLILCSLVAENGEGVIGSVIFCRVELHADGKRYEAAALAPLAVLPPFQGRGVGSQLVKMGLDICRALGIAAVFVLGDPRYYERFGFSTDATRNIKSPYSHLKHDWMGLEFVPGVLRADAVRVTYPSAFAIVD